MIALARDSERTSPLVRERGAKVKASEAMPGEAEPATLTPPLGERRHRRHHLTRYQPGLVGELIHDLERSCDPLGSVDDDRHHRDVAAKLEQPIAVRRVVAVEPPNSA